MTYIFIGYLFVFFYFKIEGLNLLPNFLGYILIATGLMKLVDKSDKFAKAKPWAISMAVYIFLIPAGALLGISYDIIVLDILELLTVPITLYISYLIIFGIQDIELNENIQLGFTNLLVVWKIHAVLQVVCALLSCFSNGTIMLILSMCTIIVIVLNIIFLTFLYKTKALHENINKN